MTPPGHAHANQQEALCGRLQLQQLLPPGSSGGADRRWLAFSLHAHSSADFMFKLKPARQQHSQQQHLEAEQSEEGGSTGGAAVLSHSLRAPALSRTDSHSSCGHSYSASQQSGVQQQELSCSTPGTATLKKKRRKKRKKWCHDPGEVQVPDDDGSQSTVATVGGWTSAAAAAATQGPPPGEYARRLWLAGTGPGPAPGLAPPQHAAALGGEGRAGLALVAAAVVGGSSSSSSTREEARAAMTALCKLAATAIAGGATRTSFSTGLDQEHCQEQQQQQQRQLAAESSSTNLHAQVQAQAAQGVTAAAGPGARSHTGLNLQEQAMDEQQIVAAAAAATGSASCKRRRESTDQEPAAMGAADIHSATSVSATSPANSSDKHTPSGEHSCGTTKQGAQEDHEIDKHSGTDQPADRLNGSCSHQQQQQHVVEYCQPDELGASEQPGGGGGGHHDGVAAAAAASVTAGTTTATGTSTSRFSTADLKCRETMFDFVSSSNSSNPVTATDPGDGDAFKSASPTFVSLPPGGDVDAQQQQPSGSQRQALAPLGRDDCPAPAATGDRHGGTGDDHHHDQAGARAPGAASDSAGLAGCQWKRSAGVAPVAVVQDQQQQKHQAAQLQAQQQQQHHHHHHQQQQQQQLLLLRAAAAAGGAAGSGGSWTGPGAAHFSIFDTGAASKRFKADAGGSPIASYGQAGASSPGKVTVTSSPPGPGGLATAAAAGPPPPIAIAGEAPQQRHLDQRRGRSAAAGCSSSWLQLGVASGDVVARPDLTSTTTTTTVTSTAPTAAGALLTLNDRFSRASADSGCVPAGDDVPVATPPSDPPPPVPAGVPAHHHRRRSGSVPDRSAFSVPDTRGQLGHASVGAVEQLGLVTYFPPAPAPAPGPEEIHRNGQQQQQHHHSLERTAASASRHNHGVVAESSAGPRHHQQQQQTADHDPDPGSTDSEAPTQYRMFLDETSAAGTLKDAAAAEGRRHAHVDDSTAVAAPVGVSLGLSMSVFPPTTTGTKRSRDSHSEEPRSSSSSASRDAAAVAAAAAAAHSRRHHHHQHGSWDHSITGGGGRSSRSVPVVHGHHGSQVPPPGKLQSHRDVTAANDQGIINSKQQQQQLAVGNATTTTATATEVQQQHGMMTVHRPTAPVAQQHSRTSGSSSWPGTKQQQQPPHQQHGEARPSYSGTPGPAPSSSLLRSPAAHGASLDHHRAAPDQLQAMRLMDPGTSLQSRLAAASQAHAWHIAAMQAGSHPTASYAAAVAAASPLGRAAVAAATGSAAATGQSRSWDEASRHAGPGAADQGQGKLAVPPPVYVDDHTWQMVVKRAQQQQQHAVPLGAPMHDTTAAAAAAAAARGLSASLRSHLPPPATHYSGHPAAAAHAVTGAGSVVVPLGPAGGAGLSTMQCLQHASSPSAMLEPCNWMAAPAAAAVYAHGHGQHRPAAAAAAPGPAVMVHHQLQLPTSAAATAPGPPLGPHYTAAAAPSHMHMSFAVPAAGPWSHKFGPHAEATTNSVLSSSHQAAAAAAATMIVNAGRDNQFGAHPVGQGQADAVGSDFLASFQHPGRAVITRPLPQRLLLSDHTASGAERPNVVAKRLADRLHPPGLWFLLQPAENMASNDQAPTSQGVYMRIKDGKMPVSYLKRYLVNRLGLQSESEVEISCKGQPITPNLPLQQVRDSLWFSPVQGTDNADSSASETPEIGKPAVSPSGELLMVLTYQRLQFSQR